MLQSVELRKHSLGAYPASRPRSFSVAAVGATLSGRQPLT